MLIFRVEYSSGVKKKGNLKRVETRQNSLQKGERSCVDIYRIIFKVYESSDSLSPCFSLVYSTGPIVRVKAVRN